MTDPARQWGTRDRDILYRNSHMQPRAEFPKRMSVLSRICPTRIEEQALNLKQPFTRFHQGVTCRPFVYYRRIINITCRWVMHVFGPSLLSKEGEATYWGLLFELFARPREGASSFLSSFSNHRRYRDASGWHCSPTLWSSSVPWEISWSTSMESSKPTSVLSCGSSILNANITQRAVKTPLYS